MRFLISGASGWIGFELVLHLKQLYGKENLQLIVVPKNSHEKEKKRRLALSEQNFDILAKDILEEDLSISEVKPFDVFFHLAAFTATETKSSRFYVNDKGTQRLLNSIKPLLRGKRVVYTGSIASLDRSCPDNTPLTENHPCHPRTFYGATKLNGELIIKKLAKDYGFEWTILRIPTAYGPGYRPGGLFDVILDGLRKRKLATRLAWPGRTSLVYIADLVKALTFLGTHSCGRNEVYHIDSGEHPTLDELIQNISQIIGVKRYPIVLPNLFWSALRFIVWFPGLLSILPHKLKLALWRISIIINDGYVFDSSKLRKILPFPYTPLGKGLPATYEKII